jgi:hypothetical protein
VATLAITLENFITQRGISSYFTENVESAWRTLRLDKEESVRLLGWCIIAHVLLNQDDFMCATDELEDAVLNWEQQLIDAANEGVLPDKGEYATSLEHFKFVLDAAWDHDSDITPDEQNLIDKIRVRFKITEREYRILEASLGKFPKEGNETHLRGEIDTARKKLQQLGFITVVRDDDGKSYDVIPEEIAAALRKVLNVDLRRYGYNELLQYKAVRKKEYYCDCLSKLGFKTTGRETNEELRELIMERVPATVILGGTSPRDGLMQDELVAWCKDLDIQSSGTKGDVVSRLIEFYDNLKQRGDQLEDQREHWYEHYSYFARRDRDFLRSQQLIDKDIEMERKFEDATRYLFEIKLGHKPLKMVGSEHADGALSFGDKLLLWDNKSKETEVNLADHIKQFDRYITQSEKPVGVFLVVAPSFTEASAAVAMKFFVEKQVMINLITADQLKELAETWNQSGKESRGSFNLLFLSQTGEFNRSLVPI